MELQASWLTLVFPFSPSAGSLQELVWLHGAWPGKGPLPPPPVLLWLPWLRLMLAFGGSGSPGGWTRSQGFLLVSRLLLAISQGFSEPPPKRKEANRRRVNLGSVSYFAC